MTLRQKAHTAQRGGETQKAERLYKALLKQECIPEDIGNLGALLTQQGKLQEAIDLYQKYLKRWPDSEQILCNAASANFQKGNSHDAINLLELAIIKNPGSLTPARQLARFFLSIKNNQKAKYILEAFCERNPKEGLGWLELGIVHCRMEAQEDALNAFECGSRILPNHCGLIANRLTIHKDLNQLNKAEYLFNSLTKEQKKHPFVEGAWSGVLMNSQRAEEAIKILEPLNKKQPEIASNWINLAACQKAIKFNLASQRSLKQGLKFCPNNRSLESALAQSFSETGETAKAIKLLKQHLKEWETFTDTHIFNIQFIGSASRLIQPEELSEIALKWEKQTQLKGVGPIWQDNMHNKLDGRRIRVGYISSDFCNHPVARFLLPVLESHDTNLVEIIGLSCGPHKDGVTELISNCCEKWVELNAANDMEIARVISDMRIDVLIELGGFTGYSRIGSLVHKPAPIQISYLGYFAPTFLKCIDGWVGDSELFESLTPLEKTHNLINIEGGYMAFKPPQLPTIDREEGEKLRFGSFNNSRKLGKDSIKLFCKILNTFPDSQLVLKSITFVEQEEKNRIRNLFIEAGLNPNQLIMLDWIAGTEAHMTLYKWVDIALDPFPYGGATTTAEALWMGVPVIALAGDGMVGRLSSSLLRSAGCDEWIAKNFSEYELIAKKLAFDGPRSINSRQALRLKVSESKLADGKRVAKELERHYIKKIEELKLY